MKKQIYTLLILLLTLVGCNKEPFEGVQIDGQLRLGVEMLDRYYAETITTRSGSFEANEREKKLFEGKGFVFAFTTDDGRLQQYVPLEKDDRGYYAILEASTVGVAVKGVANVEIPDNIQTKIDDKTLVVDDLEDIYTAYTIDNNILKNTDAGLLPKSSGTLTLAKVDMEELVGKNLTFDFDYVRVDVALPVSSEEYPKLAEIYAMNAPVLPLSTTKIEKSHTVAPTAADAKSIQGLYLYPNATKDLWSQNEAVSLMLKVEKSLSVYRYYKILLQHPPSLGTNSVYDIQRDTRYFINIRSITTDGYSTESEALAAPHANIDYNISYDDNSTHIVENSQYYIGASKGNYWANFECYQSNMLYATQDEFVYTAGNDATWVYNDDGTTTVEVAFTLGDGNNGNILSKLSGDVILPTGAKFDELTPLATDWKTTRTEQRYKINLSKDFNEGDITIKLGELTQTITLSVETGVVTDYTDKAIVEQLTGLTTQGGVAGLRVANCYIASPMSSENTIFYIPVKDRIKEFWEEYAIPSTSQYNIPDESWTNNKDYTVELSWYDGSKIDGLRVTKSFSPDTNTQTYQNAIKVFVPKGFEHQNFVVNVKKGSTIIWSWHLWATNYNPYLVSLKENENSALVYPERSSNDQTLILLGENNELHSYSGAVWSGTGIYADKFIMDRNLGAISSTYEGQGGRNVEKGAIYYQFGRKDPFPGTAGKSGQDNSVFNPSATARRIYGEVATTQNPMIFTEDFEFSDYDEYDYSRDILWSDKNTVRTDNPTDNQRQKSIFDPSPVGWRVPIFEAWLNIFFTYDYPYSTMMDTFAWTVNGREYNTFAYYPATGLRGYSTGNLERLEANGSIRAGMCWSATPNLDDIGPNGGYFANRLQFQTSNNPTDFGNGRSNGFPVRSVQE